ncbi:unnamed protein product [Mycena citricolor]|uniref:Uncharacterized protein n=2 Tax=Mycena citricolor TaxID=2018698 RepID=A0AAD2K1P5_9AGAR|nr:unnamed protein product [Mycena citricolor]
MLEYYWTTIDEGDPAKVKVCHPLQSFHQCFAVVSQILVATMLILRTYALHEQSKRVLALILMVSALVLGIGGWSIVTSREPRGTHRSDFYPRIGCAAYLTDFASRRIGFAWIGMLVFDAMILGLTISKAFMRQERGTVSSLGTGRPISLAATLVRDGTLYFLVMALANIGNIISYIYGGPYARGSATTLSNVLSSILISRFMFNLRDRKPANRSQRVSASSPFCTTGNEALSESVPMTVVSAYFGTEIEDENGDTYGRTNYAAGSSVSRSPSAIR